MTILVVLVAVSVGSIAFRAVPLLGAALMPAHVARAAGWAGSGILAGVTVRTVLHHENPSVSAPVVLAAVAVAAGLLVALRGRSMLTALAATVACYSVAALLLGNGA